MKKLQKYLYLLTFTVVLIGIAVFFSPDTDIVFPQFLIRSSADSEAQEVSIFDAENGNYYVFLPSYADMDLVTVSHPRSQLFSLGETPLSDGMNCGNFELETPYTLTMDNQEIATLWFFRSANVATMYIDTVSGNMKYLHQNKDHKETVSVTLYTADGERNYSDEHSTLKGRGNVSWEYDKRPYALTLSADNPLLDMAPATNWILLANAADETNLNNKLILDLANQVGLQWTPQCRWIDLYLNGEYSGLYLLTEKVEIHENRLDIGANPEAFLCKIDLDERWATLRNPFLTGSGRTVEITDPELLKEGQQAKIEFLVNKMEQEILSGGDLNKSTILDLDSWIRRYLIDEISANIDSDLASCYFYFSGEKFFAGPIWDYDMTLGNYPRNRDPYSFIAKNAYKSDTFYSPFYDALYQNESFYNRMLEIYQAEFVPALQNLLGGEIDQLISFLSEASQSNSLRWRSMYDNLPADVVHTPSALKDYFSRRIQFLDSAWLENTPYCTLQFESSPGSAYRNCSVEKGHCLDTPYMDTETIVWVDSATGEIFDFSQPILTDMIFSKQIEEDTHAETNSQRSKGFSTRDFLIAVLLITPIITIMILATIDSLQQRQEKRNTRRHNRRKQSP